MRIVSRNVGGTCSAVTNESNRNKQTGAVNVKQESGPVRDRHFSIFLQKESNCDFFIFPHFTVNLSAGSARADSDHYVSTGDDLRRGKIKRNKRGMVLKRT